MFSDVPVALVGCGIHGVLCDGVAKTFKGF